MAKTRTTELTTMPTLAAFPKLFHFILIGVAAPKSLFCTKQDRNEYQNMLLPDACPSIAIENVMSMGAGGGLKPPYPRNSMEKRGEEEGQEEKRRVRRRKKWARGRRREMSPQSANSGLDLPLGGTSLRTRCFT